MLLKFAFPLAAFASGAWAQATANPTCARDNCLRAIIGGTYPTRSGSADCQSYFRTTVTPATVTYTATATSITSTTTRRTEVDSATSTEIDSFTTATTITSIVQTTLTTTYTATITPANAKRFVVPEHLPLPQSLSKRQATLTPSSIPAYASACSGSVRYSSACSCVGATKTTVTAVAPSTTVTVTATSTGISTISTTTTTTLIITTSTTTTVTGSTTTTSISTAATSTSVLAQPTCTSFSEPNFTYKLVYTGFKTLNPNNPGNNAQTTPATLTFPGTMTVCQAASACAADANSRFSPVGGGYFTFNLQYHADTGNWVCVEYYDVTPTSYYNVDTPAVTQSYGYSIIRDEHGNYKSGDGFSVELEEFAMKDLSRYQNIKGKVSISLDSLAGHIKQVEDTDKLKSGSGVRSAANKKMKGKRKNILTPELVSSAEQIKDGEKQLVNKLEIGEQKVKRADGSYHSR